MDVQELSPTLEPTAQIQQLFLELATAIGAGLLVGLQRQRSNSDLAGIRTFPLIALFGAMCGVLARLFEPTGVWVVGAGFIALALVIHTGTMGRKANDKTEGSRGIVTEMAILVVFGCGLLIVLKRPGLGVAIATTTAVLLHLKPSLHRFTAALCDMDVRAIMQFAAIALIILPVVPNRTMGPFEAINPYKLWLLVVLVTGISLAGYVAIRIFGSRAGTALAAGLGGLVSSTATTVSFARMAKTKKSLIDSSCAAIAIASAVMAARVVVFAYLAARERATEMLPALGAFFVVSVAVAAVATLRAKVDARAERGGEEAASATTKQKNPAELKTALFFAGLFAVIQVVIVFAERQFGNSGLYAVAAFSGLTDMAAITLSTSELLFREQITSSAASIAIVLAAVVNTIVKLGIAWSMGGIALTKKLAITLLPPVVTGVGVIVYLLIW